jgi:transcriptional regulator
MYRPEPFLCDDPALAREILAATPFGTLISVVEGAPCVTHVPFVLDGDALLGHLARANPHSGHLGGPALATFIGPHAYVSPRWYRDPAGEVPTWNYVVVHVHGTPEVVDAAPLLARMGAAFDPTWTPGSRAGELLPAIVAFRLPLERVEVKLKLSQNKAPVDAHRVLTALDGGPESERAVATWMRRVLQG